MNILKRFDFTISFIVSEQSKLYAGISPDIFDFRAFCCGHLRHQSQEQTPVKKYDRGLIFR